MKIFLVYDKIDKGIQKGNIKTGYECVFRKNLGIHGIDMKLVPINRLQSFIKLDGLFLYPIEPTRDTLGKNIEAAISKESADLLRKFKIPILITEFDIVSYAKINFMDYISHYDDLDFYIITTNLKISTIPSSQIKKIYKINFWESTGRAIAKTVPECKTIDVLHVNPGEKTKDFLCANRNIRSHRLALVSEFIRHDLFSNCNYSIIGSNSSPFQQNMIDEAKSIVDTDGIDHLSQFAKNFEPKYLNVSEQAVTYPFRSMYPSHRETFFSLITETEVAQDVLFISEKTFRAILCFHPFLIFGSPGTLDWFRSHGYQTFPEMFDESYDEELDTGKRLSMIIDQVKRFKNLSLQQKRKIFKSVIPKLVFNRDLFWNKPDIFKSEIQKIFSDIYQNWRSVGESNS